MVQALRELIELEECDEASLQEALSLFECAYTDENANDVRKFLEEDAIQNEKDGRTRTYLILDDDSWEQGNVKINGFFSIALKNIYFNRVDKNVLVEIFGREENGCAAYLIGQLARGAGTPKGSGSEYLKLALGYIAAASDIVGGRFVYLDCKRTRQEYYEGQGFSYLKDWNNDETMIQMYKVL